jgi:DNA-binding winged helix-turn-helix (wHTH) protein
MTVAYRFGSFELQPDQRRLLAHGDPVPLGQRAFDVLHALIGRRERLVAKNELLDLVWPGVVVEENNLQVQISSLRKLLGPQAIATVPGRGYRFTAVLDGANDGSPRSTGPVRLSTARQACRHR